MLPEVERHSPPEYLIHLTHGLSELLLGQLSMQGRGKLSVKSVAQAKAKQHATNIHIKEQRNYSKTIAIVTTVKFEKGKKNSTFI